MTTNTYDERFVLAATIWAEARGEGAIGMTCVAHVIWNRVGKISTHFGLGVIGVCTKMDQFSCWNLNDPNHRHLNPTYLNGMPTSTPDGQAWATAKNIAYGVLQGGLPDPTNGATFYCTGAVSPDWEKSMVKVATIGRHQFFVPKALAPAPNKK